jgi:TRAP-type uncharacterized transport system substrate-binding protein
MLGFNRWHLFKGLAASLCILGIVLLALIYFFPAPPPTITMAVGFKGGSYELLADHYKDILARFHVELELRNSAGGLEQFKLLQDHNSGVQAAFVQEGILDIDQAPGLLSLGRINYQIFCVFYRATEVLDDLTELKGRRIAVGPVGNAGRLVAEKILGISGVTSEGSTLLPFTGQAAVNALLDGRADATILGLASDAPILQSLLRDSRIRLMSVTRAEALTRFFPFLVRLVLPQGAIDFEKKIPASDIVIFSTTNAILVRNDLHPAHISLLARALKETHSKRGLFQEAGEFPTQTDPEFPMAEGAVEFYKDGPSFLNKYLPFWVVPHVHRLLAALLAGGAIVFPLFSFAPRLFKSLVGYRLGALYRRLRAIEANLQKDLSVAEVSALESELESVNRAIHLLGVPKQHSDLFFSIKSHLELVRIDVGLRRAELQSQFSKTA